MSGPSRARLVPKRLYTTPAERIGADRSRRDHHPIVGTTAALSGDSSTGDPEIRFRFLKYIASGGASWSLKCSVFRAVATIQIGKCRREGAARHPYMKG